MVSVIQCCYYIDFVTRFQSLVEVHYDNLSLKLFNGFLSESAEL